MNTIDLTTEIPKFRVQLAAKKRSAIVWIAKYVQYRDRSSALNAALAVGRVVGFLEHFDAQLRNADILMPDDLQQDLEQTFHVWSAILSDQPEDINAAWLTITPV